ncbi:MAG: phage holin family protein [Clostridia bacterium]|nr:phage holin family protein [Clostridia bacterium]
MKEDTAKLLIAAVSAALWSYFKNLFAPLVILIVVMVVDYISGVAAAWVRHELSSRTGLIGIVKKLSYLALVVAGCSIDYLVSILGEQLTGTEISIKAIGLVVVCWLIINELISILENVARQGGPVPPFLASILKHLRETTEKQIPGVSDTDTIDGEGGKHERR